ncbi:hypothetical protein M0R72_18410 [Candidatus Pacearchaeota archaeon]|jgi:hypothetical protein|nr:hypothetical protein [Candidatus Pacearchaeota archaeon]
MKIREIEGSRDECIAYLKWYEGREDLIAEKPATPPKIKDLMEWDANMPDQAPKGKFGLFGQPQEKPAKCSYCNKDIAIITHYKRNNKDFCCMECANLYDSPRGQWIKEHEDLIKSPNSPLSQKDETRLPSEGRSSNLGNSTQPTAILPTRSPPKERTAKLEAIFRDYLKAGFNAKAIQEHLIKEHDTSMNGHQIAGWMGRMKQQEKHDADYKRVYDELISPCEKMLVKGRQMPEDAPKTELEGNCSPQAESVKEELIWIPACPGEEVTTKGGKSEVKASPLVECLSDLTQRPCNLSEPDLTILKMHQAGNMDIDIRQKLERMGHPMKVGDIRKRIDQMKVKG